MGRRTRPASRFARLSSWLLLVTLLVGCAGGEQPVGEPSAADGVRIASFDFVESELLAEVYAQVLEDRGVPVVRLGPVGPREIIGPSLEVDLIDLVPEYLGTALHFYGSSTSTDDPTHALASLRRVVGPLGLVVLEPAEAQDTNAIVVRVDLAEELALGTISDLGPHASRLRFGGPVECPERPLCLEGLASVYGLRFAEFVPQRDLGVTVAALDRDEIDVGLLFTSAAELDDPALIALEDDLGLQPSENVVPVLRQSALDRWGLDIATALDRVSARLTTPVLRRLNRGVAEGGEVQAVVRSWLVAEGLVTAG